MYISVADAAEEFNISKRRVQILCEHGSLFDDIYNNKDEKLNISQACELLSISRATAKNWIRLGKLKINSDGETFDKQYIETLLTEIKTSKDNRLKSRRNKKNVSGKMLYKDYVKSEWNREIVEGILNDCEQITENELRIILANFAVQLYQQSRGVILSENTLLLGQAKITNHSVFNDLIRDLLGNVDISQVDLSKIQSVVNRKVQFVPLEDTLGFVYISLRDLSHRKQTGAYYTPEKTVAALIGNMKKCVDLEGRSVCDPCCGTGNFLIGLVGNGAKIVNLYGQDIDEISILITRINMFLLDNNIAKEQLYSQFVCDNTLTKTFSRKFSIVLGNPPWGYNFNKEEMSYLVANYVTAKSKGMESYDLFVEKGLAMLEKNGYLVYVLPEAVLSVASQQQARKLIVENMAFKFVNYIGNAFSGVQCPAIILGVQNGYHGETKGCKVEFDNHEFTVNKDRDIDAKRFSFNVSDEEYDCLSAISSIQNARYLANNARFALGIVTGNNKKYITDTRMEGMEVILKGSDIFRYAVKEDDSYIHFVPEKFQQVAPTEMYRAEEKLLYRFIAEVPVFTYDNQQTLSLNSCNILIPQIEGMDIKYVLAVLNSSIAAYFINKKYNSVKLLRSHIESLPIPMVSAETQKDIIKKVDHIIISSEDISVLYEEIDNEIMNIYSLSEKHRSVIHAALSGKNLFL